MTLAEAQPRQAARRRSGLARLTGLLLAGLVVPMAFGAEIRVRVSDVDGAPLPDTDVRLVIDDPGVTREDGSAGFGIAARSGPDGVAVFRDVLPGRFLVTSDRAETEFIRPEHTFPPSTVRLAIRDPDGTHDAELVLRAGRPLFLRFVVAQTAQRHWASVVAVNVDTRQRIVARIDQADDLLLTLVPGRWNVTLTPPPGLLLAGLRVDGRETSGHQVNLDLRDAFATARLEWQFNAPARITGRVTFDRPDVTASPVDIRASLLRPGAWFDEARRRGGSDYTTVTARANPVTGEFLLEIPAGRWQLEARDASGAIAPTSTRRIELLDGEEQALDFQLERSSRDVVATANDPPLPTASPVVSARLYCIGGTLLPSRVDVRLFPTEDDPVDSRNDTALLAANAVPLAGGLRNRVTVGMDRADGAVLAVRPTGFDRWTTVAYENSTATDVDLDAIGIDCTPHLRVGLGVASGRPGPDLRETDGGPQLELAGTVRTPSGKTLDIDDFRIESTTGALIVHDLPPGAADLRVRIGHPFFVPDYWIEIPVDGLLGAGRTLEVTGVVDDVGGAIVVRAPGAAAIRLIAADREERRGIFQDGAATLSNVPAGRYSVEICQDSACRSLLYTWASVGVRPLETVELVRP